ncbi:hypothetical protein Ddc_20703 [Ditylenchus destructor]|nr:hypothetical protein Ddc_20703 [Ditylenchus destructor]
MATSDGDYCPRKASLEMGSFGFASEEIKAAFEKVFNKSRLSSEQMENYKLYLLNYINRFAGNETFQTSPTMGSFGFTSEEIKAAFEKIRNKIDLSSETFKLYLVNNISRFAGTETIQTPVASTIQGYQRFLPQNVTPQIWYISVFVLIPTTLFMYTRFMRNKHPNVKFAVFLIIQSMLSFCLSFLHSIFTNELNVPFDTANVIVILILFLLELLVILGL